MPVQWGTASFVILLSHRADSGMKKQAGPMKFEKADPEIVKFFDEIAPGLGASVEKRQMFGYPCRFVNGNLFMGLHGNNMILRLSEKDRTDFAELGAKPFEPMPGRIMKEYVIVPKDILKSHGLKVWIDRSLAYASNLPPKQKKKKKN
jgi:TfoX/Sxy family transcriptional regulator of competence genes